LTCWFARIQAAQATTRDGLIERLQGRVELGEGAFLAGRQAVGVVAADVATPPMARAAWSGSGWPGSASWPSF
jgi:hypothetical protein